MSEGIVHAVFFCVFSVFSIKKMYAEQKCAEKTRRGEERVITLKNQEKNV